MVELVYKFDEKSYHECLKGESIAKVCTFSILKAQLTLAVKKEFSLIILLHVREVVLNDSMHTRMNTKDNAIVYYVTYNSHCCIILVTTLKDCSAGLL